jgi:hypothetical protein
MKMAGIELICFVDQVIYVSIKLNYARIRVIYFATN